jgi:hypothetical protein
MKVGRDTVRMGCARVIVILICLGCLGVSARALTFHSFMGAEAGRIYTATTDGNLLFYWHDPENGTFSWRNGGNGQQIGGPSWATPEHVLYNGNGIIYTVPRDGRLDYYRDLARDGTMSWANGGVAVEVGLARGWADYIWLLAGDNGVIYAIDRAGVLWFYKHLTQDQNPVWANSGNARQIGSGWNAYKRVFSGHNGVLFAIGHDGTLYYNRDLAQDGTSNWQFGAGGLTIGSGWDQFHHVFSTGNGNIYAVAENGTLRFYHVTISGSVPVWENGGGDSIGFGFVPELWEKGYCWPLSAAPGEEIDFKISGKGAFGITWFRHKANRFGLSSLPMGTTNCVTRIQPVLDDVKRYGCGWTTSVKLRIPNNWPSGIYSAYCSNALSNFYITFIVKPAPNRRSGVAVLANVNTWLAYNDYDKYNGRSHLSFLKPHANTRPLWDPGADLYFHLTAAELWILGFLEDQGYQPDVYTDLDFHNDVDLHDSPCLIFGTHPEYWSMGMYQKLQRYLGDGGSLLYLGGNGVYEVTEYIDDQTGMVFLGGVEGGDRAEVLFRRLNPPMPERAVLGVATEHCGATAAPYLARRVDHPFFVGTGLINGSPFGTNGSNPLYPAACGLEVDSSDGPGAIAIPFGCGTLLTVTVPPGPGLPARLMVLATEQDPDYTRGADMTYYPHPGGGFVFSVGSISFGGSLVVDSSLQQILRNALAEAFIKTPRLSVVPLSRTIGQISLRGRFGAAYAIQASPNLRSGSWVTVANLILNDSLVKTLDISFNTGGRFYRAVLQP